MFDWANNTIDGRPKDLWESQKQKKKKEYGTLLELAIPLRFAQCCNTRIRQRRKLEKKKNTLGQHLRK